jgi:hypothetical protein
MLLQRCHNSVRALGYDDKTGLAVIAGDGSSSGSGGGSGFGSSSSSSSSGQRGLSSADAFAAEGVTVSAWQLREQELTLKFSLGKPQVCVMLVVNMLLLTQVFPGTVDQRKCFKQSEVKDLGHC